MKERLICFFLILGSVGCFGQASIVEEIEKKKFGEGEVLIYQDSHLLYLLGSKEDKSELSSDGDALHVLGYRVQVFSGNSQRASKEEASRKQQLIRGYDSELTTYISYKSPFWRLRVGDFRSYEEAFLFMKQLAKEFPSFGKEMNVVREDIIIPL